MTCLHDKEKGQLGLSNELIFNRNSNLFVWTMLKNEDREKQFSL